MNFRMIKTNKEDLKAEFDGFVIEDVSSKDGAWKVVFGLDGRWGIPNENQYELVKIHLME